MDRRKRVRTAILLVLLIISMITTIPASAYTDEEIKFINSKFNEADFPGQYEGKATLVIYKNEQTIQWDTMFNNSYDVIKPIRGPLDYIDAKANIVKAGDGFDIDLTITSKEKVEFHDTLHAQYSSTGTTGGSDSGNHRYYHLFLNGVKLDKHWLAFTNSEQATKTLEQNKGCLDWWEDDYDYKLKSTYPVEAIYNGNIYLFVLNNLKKVSDITNKDDLGMLKSIPGISNLPDDVKKLPPWIIITGGIVVALIVLKILAKILKALSGGSSKPDTNNKEKKDKKLKRYLLQISQPEIEITAGEKGSVGVTAWYVDSEGRQGVAGDANITIVIDSNRVESGIHPVPASGHGKVTCVFNIPQDAKEAEYSVSVIAEADGNSISSSFTLKIHEAKNPAVDVDKDFNYLRCKSGGKAEVKAWVDYPGSSDWNFQYQFIDDGGTQNASIKIEKVDKTKANIFITDIGLEPKEGEYDVRGAILVTAVEGDRRSEGRRVNITICQEGIYVTDGQDTDGKIIIRGDLSKNDAGWKKELDLAVMEWDETKNELVSNATAATNIKFDSFSGENETINTILQALPMKTEFIKPRPGNIAKGVYAFYFDHVIPGMKDDELGGNMRASVNTSKGEISSAIKFSIKTAKRGEGLADWKKELDQCTKFIGNFIPEPYKAQKLKELEIRKDVMGAEDFKEFRAMCWDVAYFALMRDKKSYDDVTYWAEAQVTTLEWIQWIGDRAFALAVGSLTGTYLAFAAAQLKDALVLFIQKYQETDKDTWTFLWDDIIQDRMTNLLGSILDSSFMDMPDVKVSSETAIGWMSIFFLYKVTWHWLYDMDEGGSRKGLICSVKASALDLTAVAIEKGFGDFVKQSLGKIKENKDGRFSSEFINKIDSLLTKGNSIDKKIGDTLERTKIAKTFSDAKDGMEKIYDKTAGAEVDHVLDPMMNVGYKIGSTIINTLRSV